MKAVILAAGKGTRLGGEVPKPMTPLFVDHSIIDLQIEKLSKIVGRENITIVVGFEKHYFLEAYPDMHFVHNDNFENNNTGKSLLVALETIENDSVLWTNGDVYFDQNVLELLTQQQYTCALVDTKKCSDEEIKYTLNPEGTIDQLSKVVPITDALGEAVGINMVIADDLELFKNELRAIGETDYFEKALEQLTTTNQIDMHPVEIGDLFCHEIDFPEDLAFVREHLEQVDNR